MRRYLNILVGIFAFNLTVAALAAAHQDNPWRVRAKQDLVAIQKIIRQQTPIAVDRKNPVDQKWLQTGFNRAVSRLLKVKDYRSYAYVLRYYINGFHDDQLQLLFDFSQLKDKQADQYPGFFLRYFANKFLVSQTAYQYNQAKDLPPINASLESCDGLLPSLLIKRNILPFYGEEGWRADWVMSAPYLLVKDGNPWAEPIINCVFYYDGRRHHINLTWQPMPSEINIAKVAYSYQPITSMGILGHQGVWFSIASLTPSSSEARARLAGFVKKLKSLRKRDPIVFDLRGNRSRNSLWLKKILANLYGQAYFSFIEAKHIELLNSFWRVSKANLNFLQSRLIPQVNDIYGKQGLTAHAYDSLLEALREGLAENKNLVEMPLVGISATHSAGSVRAENPVDGRVFIVVDGRCRGSCMQVVNAFSAFPDVTVVGNITGASSAYSNLRQQKLPSTYASLDFPMRVWQSELNQPNTIYKPAKLFSGDINNTKALQQWILNLTVNHP
ncbi:MAG: hypothetical protein K0U12_02595 [Gammaproteobacteria bacterium]|nr:hypothetical protein [Gammaproteobacteria bacterium]